MKDLISIIVPVHNSSKYLEKCINSLINQTYKNIEIICIENGSTDNGLEILNKYKDKIKILIQKNPGLSLARNTGIKNSNGKYISFVDSDDNVLPTFIEELYNVIKTTDADISVCNYNEILEENKETKKISSFPNETIKEKEIKENLVNFNYAIWNKLYKKDIITKNKIYFPENIKYEDIPFVLKYLINAKSISKTEKYLYNYYIHKNSEQTTVDKRIFDIIDIMDICKTMTDKNKLEDLYIKHLTTYSLKTRYMKNNKDRNLFINTCYNELNENYPNWKKSKYIKNKNIFKKIIIKNKLFVKLYTWLYSLKYSKD